MSAGERMITIKENKFEVKCKSCGHSGEAKDFVVETDVWLTIEKVIERKEVTIKCPNCGASETLPLTLW